MSSVSDPIDIDIEIRRRGSGYILIEHKFSVVVRSKELQSGIEELERRVAIVCADFRELGITAPSDGASMTKPAGGETARPAVASSLIMIITVGAVLALFVLFSTAPIVIAMAGLRSEISSLVPTESGGGIAGTGHVGIDFIVKLSQTMEQVTPERKEQLRAAIRNIAREVNLIVEDVKAPPASSPPPPSSGDKR